MDDVKPSLAEVEAYAHRHGLANLTPEHLQRLCEQAAKITQAGRDVPRVASKFTQPANIFAVKPGR